MPAAWYAYIPGEARERTPRQREAPSPRSVAGTVSTFNNDPDQRMLQRYQASGHSSINAMMEGHSPTIPQHNSKPVCLSWALKGECSATCKRKEQHVRCSQAICAKVHSLLDACGVANPQE